MIHIHKDRVCAACIIQAERRLASRGALGVGRHGSPGLEHRSPPPPVPSRAPQTPQDARRAGGARAPPCGHDGHSAALQTESSPTGLKVPSPLPAGMESQPLRATPRSTLTLARSELPS